MPLLIHIIRKLYVALIMSASVRETEITKKERERGTVSTIEKIRGIERV